MQIRNYNTKDKDELQRIFDLNVPKYFDPKEAILLSNFLDKHGDDYLVLEHNNIIVGSVGYHTKEEETRGAVTWIFFHPDHQGKGYGKIAVNHCLEKLRAYKSIKTIEVRTSQLVYNFFSSFGFKVLYTKKDYWGEGLDLYYMEMSID